MERVDVRPDRAAIRRACPARLNLQAGERGNRSGGRVIAGNPLRIEQRQRTRPRPEWFPSPGRCAARYPWRRRCK